MKIVVAQRIAAAMACFGMLIQPALAGAPIVESAPAVADIALSNGGVFVGKVVTAQGAPLAKVAVSLQQAGNEVAKTTTDAEGVFAVQGLRGGLYQVVSEGGVVSYRLWAENTAPPAANQSALIVTGGDVVNGQYCPPMAPCPPTPSKGAGVLGWMREHPLLVAAGVATAIAVPLALADDDDPAS
ncbi:carboxypeptidase-like regulatory domain-containing protein [Botrimarina mediterranea]|uniref:Carboxypeptidase regulatory-like domain-containing protein n=1 Tax=Botrimarina mediterranea TaxID=2528022 RepID=A0A518K6S5_9BACT|nr:carboxypeptidase-like regulatory domain-containing protein [Botrimarina mediterranea]QDV73499.1 hypothetical protein Spa11_16950 [Botrimarina mediterranea]QDV78016.1 hypothetical protein K2D_16210 [Planctomycetes bacterium K2D]